MIKPTVGRIVWFHPGSWHANTMTWFDHSQPMAATVVYVHGDRWVNLTVCDQGGQTHGLTNVTLVQEGDARPAEYFAEWIPFQKGQAAKTEAFERRIDPGAAA